MRILAALAGLLALTSCKEQRVDVRPSPARLAVFSGAARESEIQPGGSQSQPVVTNPVEGNAYAISEGQRLFNWYNCSGCHANGGGGIGPPLIKQVWTYGGEPANLFDTIIKGRPNGMPAWGGRIPEYQIWQIVAYVRSLNNLEPRTATPARADTLETRPGTIQNEVKGVTK
ncbi:MAG TPA: c-type cytochrome [Bryobacteraceae bacterium]|nr:c-type cytochrome [Bryobacteraceae bacterium]